MTLVIPIANGSLALMFEITGALPTYFGLETLGSVQVTFRGVAEARRMALGQVSVLATREMYINIKMKGKKSSFGRQTFI